MTGTNIIIFGGTGDLTYRKLIPALYNMANDNIKIYIIGRRNYSNEEYIQIIQKWTEKYSRIKYDEKTFEKFSNNITYINLDFTKDEEYKKLSKYITSLNNIFYLAVAPRFFEIIGTNIKDYQGKIVIEKPFGENIEQATKLNENLEKWFKKENIFHIDHYLGKEMIQNLLTIRFNNPIFEKTWNKEHIKYVQIIASEEEGVGTRAGYYDQSGALKDMVQNHLMQILSIIAMEPQNEQNSIKQRQLQVINQLTPLKENQILLGQYEGYTDEENIQKDSKTETLAFLKLYINNNRWDKVPFYILTGKKLKTRELNVIITYKNEQEENKLTFKIQPLEGVSLTINQKDPNNNNIKMDMDIYQDHIPLYQINTKEAYERLLTAIMNDDHTWFSHWDLIKTSWEYINQINHQSLVSYNQEIPDLSAVLDDPSHNWTTSQLTCKIGDINAKI